MSNNLLEATDSDVWVPLPLAAGRTINVGMSFLSRRAVTEKVVLTGAQHNQDFTRARFTFDRSFETSMARSPDHLTPVAGLLIAQNIYYCLLCARAGHIRKGGGERFKIWPVAIDARIPSLITTNSHVGGELNELSSRRVPTGSVTLYPGKRPVLVQGTMTLAGSMVFVFSCLIYDFGAQNGA